MIQFSLFSHDTDQALFNAHKLSLENVLNQKNIGFFDLPNRNHLIQDSVRWGTEFAKNFDTLVVLGIGGSSLGGRVIEEALAHKSNRKLLVWDNIDPRQLNIEFAKLSNLQKTAWVAISKSGSTLETLTQVDWVIARYAEKNLNALKNMAVITEKKSNPLYDWAQANKLPTLEIPLDVGGRFSVLSPVGLFPAAFLGLDVPQLMAGAKTAVKDSTAICELSAQSEMSFDRHEWITAFWIYSSGLKTLGLWVQQLWAESLAKKHNLAGHTAKRASTPLPLVGPTDQHSVLQQVAEGYKDKFVAFLRVKECEQDTLNFSNVSFSTQKLLVSKNMGELLAAEAQATALGLLESKVSTLTMQIEKIDEFSLGYLFMYFELVVAVLGERLGINTYDQPGVELGKKITRSLLEGK